mmetsp:Transcript_71906/g.150280  ORF Transcript_71906/g.150280 Transcript_71906/m.150280 type:complete len:267 (+) Transcript_71906:169-969(+)
MRLNSQRQSKCGSLPSPCRCTVYSTFPSPPPSTVLARKSSSEKGSRTATALNASGFADLNSMVWWQTEPVMDQSLMQRLNSSPVMMSGLSLPLGCATSAVCTGRPSYGSQLAMILPDASATITDPSLPADTMPSVSGTQAMEVTRSLCFERTLHSTLSPPNPVPAFTMNPGFESASAPSVGGALHAQSSVLSVGCQSRRLTPSAPPSMRYSSLATTLVMFSIAMDQTNRSPLSVAVASMHSSPSPVMQMSASSEVVWPLRSCIAVL